MDTRVAVISIIVENPAAIEELNHYLHEAGEYIIEEWEFRTGRRELISSASPLMHRKI